MRLRTDTKNEAKRLRATTIANLKLRERLLGSNREKSDIYISFAISD